MTNLNLLFNKLYYEKLRQPDFDTSVKAHNETLFSTLFERRRDYKPCPLPNAETFLLKTTYPGLLIGTGNPHGVNESKVQDINSGFSFSYVSGQPFIPASSVKGVLRSHFKYHPAAVCAVLQAQLSDDSLTEQDIKALEKEIFDDEGDIFLDAVLFAGDEYGRVMAPDYITPHPDPTANPIPIFIAKVLPDVRFEFRFILTDSMRLSASQKKTLFKELLVLFGVGAKTRVGYGALTDCTDAVAENKPLPTYTQPSPQQPRTQQQARDTARTDPQPTAPSRSTICSCGQKNYEYSYDRKKHFTHCKNCGKPLRF